MKLNSALIGALILILAQPAESQEARSRLAGRVVADDGTPVGGALVQAIARAGPTHSATTDGTGRFSLLALPAGEYRVEVRRIGFGLATVPSLVLDPGGGRSLLIRLSQVPIALDSLLVTAEPVVTVDRMASERTRIVSQRELTLLPVANDVRSLIGFLPGVRPDHVWGGATAQANNYRLDGIPVNHPGLGGDLLQPNLTWVDRIEVKGLGTGAEYGDFQGGIVNVVTKSGGGRLDAALRTTLESHRLNGSNLRSTEIGQEPGSRWEADAQLRGPLLRDRLTFAAFGQLVTRDDRVLNHVRFIPEELSPQGPETRDLKLLGKLNWSAGSAGLVTASAARIHSRVERFGLGGFESPEATQRATSGYWYYNLAWQRSFSAKSYLEVRVGGLRGSERLDPYAGSDVPGLRTIEPDPKLYRNAPFRERREPRSLTLSTRWERDVATGGLSHHLKLGGEHTGGSWLAERRRNGGLTWRPGDRRFDPVFLPSDPSTWPFSGVITSTWGGEVQLDAGLQSSALYFQDDVALNRFLGLNLGARLGRWRGSLAPAIGAPRFKAVSDVALEPRVGASLDPSGRGTMAFKVHWGQYHQGLFAGLFDRTLGGSVFSDEERWEYSGPLFTDPATIFTVAQRDQLAGQGSFSQVEVVRLSEVGRVEGYRQPYVNQLVLGVEAALGRGQHWKAEAVWVDRRNRNMVALVDRNLKSNYTEFVGVRVLDRFSRPVYFSGEELVLPKLAVSNEDLIREWELFKSGQTLRFPMPPGWTAADFERLTYQPDFVLTTVPEARRSFRQLQLVVNGRYPGWWVSGSATVTTLEGNLNSVTGNDEDSRSGAGPYVRLNEQYNALGILGNQSKVEVKIQGGGNLAVGLRGGAFLSYATGDQVTPYLTLSSLLLKFDFPGYPDLLPADRVLWERFVRTAAGQRIYLLPRGSLRYPARWTLDLHLERGFGSGRSGQMVVTVDGFNVLGADVMTAMQATISTDAVVGEDAGYGRVLNRLAPRTLRVGVAVRR